MATITRNDYDKANSASVGTLSDGSTFSGLNKVQPIPVSFGNSSSSTGEGVDCEFTITISNRDEFTVVEAGGTTTKAYEIENFNGSGTTWILVYGNWDSDGSNQVEVLAGGGDDNDYSSGGSGSNPWSGTGVNAGMIQHLNETSGSYLDSSSNDVDSVSVDVTSRTATGQFDGAPEFDGSDDDIGLGADNFSSSDVSTHTITGWAKIDDLPSNSGNNFDIFNVERGLLRINIQQSNDKATYTIYDGNDGVDVQSSSAVPLGEWIFVAGVYDGSTMEIFVNGDSNNSASQGAPDLDGFNRVGTIGNNGDNVNPLDGVIDEARLFLEDKSSNWIQADYDSSPKGGQTFFSWNGETTTGPKFTPQPINYSYAVQQSQLPLLSGNVTVDGTQKSGVDVNVVDKNNSTLFETTTDNNGDWSVNTSGSLYQVSYFYDDGTTYYADGEETDTT